MKKHYSRISLSRRIFLYLIGVAFISVITLGSFWIESTLSGYNKDVNLLKKTFAETKKLEIKNKILQVKDYIQWIQEMPLAPLSQTLATQICQLKLPSIKNGASSGNLPETLLNAFKDSVGNSRVPVYIVDEQGKCFYSYNPFSNAEYDLHNAELTLFLNQAKKRNALNKGILKYYSVIEPNDSVLKAVGYYNNEILPGFKVVSFVDAENFRDILQVHILDSVSRMRYSVNEYIFINSFDGKGLITNGIYNKSPIDIYNSGNKAWIDIFKIQRSSAVNPNGVFYSYVWQKLSDTSISSKTSFFSYIPEWKWIIGTGFYKDDINTTIEIRRKALFQDMRKNLLNIVIYLLVSSVICYFLVMLLSKRLGNNIKLFTLFFEKASNENILIDKTKVSYSEFAHLADAANHMAEARKLSDNALNESEERYRLFFDYSMDAVLLTTPDGAILQANPAACEMFGKTEEDLKQHGRNSIIDENDPRLAPALEERMRTGQFKGELTGLRKDGTLFPIEITSALFQDSNDNIHTSMIIRDISGRKLAEESIRQLNQELEQRVAKRTSQLEAANKELEAFSYSVSHDLRAPLRAIHGFTQILLDDYSEKLDVEGKRFCSIIKENSLKMGHLIDDILEFSRISRLELRTSTINMKDLINSVYYEVTDAHTREGIDLTVDCICDAVAEPNMMRRVWSNLLSNAIKYSSKRERTQISVTCETEDMKYIYCIRDNGIGFNMEYVDKLFGVFQRLHGTKGFEGTGVGLAIVKRIIHRHGGEVWAEGVVDKGAAFYFSLPIIKDKSGNN